MSPIKTKLIHILPCPECAGVLINGDELPPDPEVYRDYISSYRDNKQLTTCYLECPRCGWRTNIHSKLQQCIDEWNEESRQNKLNG